MFYDEIPNIKNNSSSSINDNAPQVNDIENYIKKGKFDKETEHEKKGLDFSIFLVKNLLFFLVFICACKVILDIDSKKIDLNEYFSLLIPIITTALGYILGKKNN